MKNYLLLSVISFYSLLAPTWSADHDPLAADKPAKSSGQAGVIQELLSQKFCHFGEKLNREIQRLKEETPFQKLSSIRKSIEDQSSPRSKRRKEGDGIEQKEDGATVAVFVKKAKKENDAKEKYDEDKAFKQALLAAAYFPKELETRGDPLTIIPGRLVPLKYIHRQLADALFYNHPLARQYLREASNLCNMPLDDSEFYSKIYDGDDEPIDQYDQYILPVKSLEVSGVKDEEADTEEAINFPFDSRETLDYFQALIVEDQHPEKRIKK